ncbi:MAG TPA: hypothetical protein VHK88_15685, partial [Aquihabitans sp.]|nr:hypothetical protein [Aquihabitans sp.]
MTDPDRPPDRGWTSQLVEVAVADPPEAWARAGFAVDRDGVRIGATTFRLTGPQPGARGIVGWAIAGLDAPDGEGTIDGLPTTFMTAADPAPPTAADPAADPAPPQPNGVVGLDHVVVRTPDLERTIAAFGDVGLACRRIRETTGPGGAPMRQAFLRVGATIIEVVGGATGSGEPASEAPATWFGLALDADDLDRTAAALGDGLGRTKPAVQEGRRIATF